jgi:hypothetical protein
MTDTRIDEEIEQLIEDLVDIEECVRGGRPVPHAHRYRYRVNKQYFITESPELSREQILERAHLVPTDQYRLRLKRRHGPPVEIKPGETVHLRDHGIERFIAQHKEVQDGLESRRQFTLPAEDVTFLDGLNLQWEAVVEGPTLWVIIYGVTLPPGYTAATADVAIEIAPGYPTSQLDMAYFYPALARTGGQAIACSSDVRQLDGKGWQRWSRHRMTAAPWVPGEDNLERHYVYMLHWLTREVGQ